MDITWGRKVASVDGRIGVLDGAWVAVGSRLVTHLVVRRGVVFSRCVAVLSDHLERSDRKGLYLRLSTLDVLALPGARNVYRDASSVALGRGTQVLLKGGLRLRLAGVRVSSDAFSLTHLLVRRLWPAQRTRLLPADMIDELSPWRLTANVGAHELLDLPRYHRPDHGIEDGP